jgi:hypothetical protein
MHYEICFLARGARTHACTVAGAGAFPPCVCPLTCVRRCLVSLSVVTIAAACRQRVGHAVMQTELSYRMRQVLSAAEHRSTPFLKGETWCPVGPDAACRWRRTTEVAAGRCSRSCLRLLRLRRAPLLPAAVVMRRGQPHGHARGRGPGTSAGPQRDLSGTSAGPQRHDTPRRCRPGDHILGFLADL